MSNNPPCPVLESIAAAMDKPTECGKIKVDFGIVSRRHGSGANRNGKRKPKEKGLESHHVLQDKAMVDLVGKRDGLAVLLGAANGGTHDQINADQIGRNCPGPGPANFGELKVASRQDLAKVLEGREHEGKKMTKEEAEFAADCLVAEAEKHANKVREDNKKKPLTNKTGVAKVKGCFAYGTLIWLNENAKIAVETLQSGDVIETLIGPMSVIRTDACVTTLVELGVGSTQVAIAPFHRVHLANGHSLKAEMLKVGHQVETAFGPQRVQNVRFIDRAHDVVSFAMKTPAGCRIGPCGLWVDVYHLGPRVSMTVNIDSTECKVSTCQS